MIKKFCKKHNLPKFREEQFNQLFYKEFINSFEELFTWPKNLRKKLKNTIDFSTLNCENQQISDDGNTIKVLFKQRKGTGKFESVLMKHKDGRNTVCISCMIGCPVGCKFCATGNMGFKTNLSSQEILDQIMFFQRKLKLSKEKITNIVFMGMGEPLLNFEEILSAIKIISDPKKMALSPRRITISTIGIPLQIEKLISVNFRGRLAISLHAPTQNLRTKLIPIAKKYPLSQLIQVIDKYIQKTNKRISIEYILIEKINDEAKHAKQLAKLFRNKLIHINLIPYNPIKKNKFKKPEKNRIYKFGSILKSNNINFSYRVTMGDSIKAACGQLANQ